ncbi:MAG: hypothetical protein JWO56_340 [Acidobacteria bacterium]|nr:hypothetical protein [Acidobacteriota bacterium]
MPDLDFAVEGADAIPYAAVPTIGFRIRIRNAEPDEPVRNVALQVQMQIEPAQRSYKPGEKKRLNDLFGEPGRWGHTLKTLLWTRTTLFVAPFTGETIVELPVHCTFDFNVAVTKYFGGLDDGVVPLTLLFSGSVFYEEDGLLRIGQISWSREATYRLPVSVWRAMMDLYYPGTAWLCLERQLFERFVAYKTRHGLDSFERALGNALDAAEELDREHQQVANE